MLVGPADPSAFLLGMGAVWTATQPDMLGGELTDLWPMLQNDMNNFLGNMSMLDCECRWWDGVAAACGRRERVTTV
jgi:hypothetical protein